MVFRNLETNKKIILPKNTHLRLLVTSVDVLHNWIILFKKIKINGLTNKIDSSEFVYKTVGNVFFDQCA